MIEVISWTTSFFLLYWNCLYYIISKDKGNYYLCFLPDFFFHSQNFTCCLFERIRHNNHELRRFFPIFLLGTYPVIVKESENLLENEKILEKFLKKLFWELSNNFKFKYPSKILKGKLISKFGWPKTWISVLGLSNIHICQIVGNNLINKVPPTILFSTNASHYRTAPTTTTLPRKHITDLCRGIKMKHWDKMS